MEQVMGKAEIRDSLASHAEDCKGLEVALLRYPPIYTVQGCTCGRGRVDAYGRLNPDANAVK